MPAKQITVTVTLRSTLRLENAIERIAEVLEEVEGLSEVEVKAAE